MTPSASRRYSAAVTFVVQTALAQLQPVQVMLALLFSSSANPSDMLANLWSDRTLCISQFSFLEMDAPTSSERASRPNAGVIAKSHLRYQMWDSATHVTSRKREANRRKHNAKSQPGLSPTRLPPITDGYPLIVAP